VMERMKLWERRDLHTPFSLREKGRG
jgi:hypothetical protein